MFHDRDSRKCECLVMDNVRDWVIADENFYSLRIFRVNVESEFRSIHGT